MKPVGTVLCLVMILFVFDTGKALCQEPKSDIAQLVMAVRKGIVEAQQLLEKEKFSPMFLVKDMELTISFTVEKSAAGGLSIKVVTLGGEAKHERTHTVTIRSETAALQHIKERIDGCLSAKPGNTYPFCLETAYKELGLTAAPIHR